MTATGTSKVARILYVDDAREARVALERALRKPEEFWLDVAETGAEALKLAGRNHYDVIATDLYMPGMDGIELIDRLHRMVPGAAFVLVTGAVDLDLPTETDSARSIACIIRKPWRMEELVGALREAVALRERRIGALPTCAGGRMRRQKILLVEDNEGDAVFVQACLAECDPSYDITHVGRLSEAIDLLEKEKFSVVLADLSLPDARGMDAISRLQLSASSMPVIVLSGLADKSLALQAVHNGAQDYLVKGEVDGHALDRAIRYAMERKGTEERLAYLAHYDQLTGLANRTLFRERVDRSIGRARRNRERIGLLVLDLDRFKRVNDTLGHDAADSLLIAIAARLRRAVRESDTVARLGGDEFAVLIDGIDDNDKLSTPAARILESLRDPVYVDGHELVVTISIGIASFPDNGQNIEELLKNADSAMYRAKECGRNNYQFFDEQMHERAVQRIKLENDLRDALARGEFEVYYQPFNAIDDGQTSRFEGLVRWNHPRHGIILPEQFIPVLEEIGQIVPVGDWILQQGCAQASAWRRRYGRDFCVAINLSAKQFGDADLVAKVSRALAAANLPGECLELELTEDLLMRDSDWVSRVLGRLKSLGVRISIDDFGTGYSRLGHLAEFPLDVLKIDGSVIKTIGAPRGDSVVAAVIDLGHTLGLEVVAEGVEDEKQIAFLRSERCDSYQGFITSRPMRATEATKWLMRWESTSLVQEPAQTG